MATAPTWNGRFHFGPFEMDFNRAELRKTGMRIRLQPQPFHVLAILARRSGDLVTREEIQHQLWGEETHVDFENGLNYCIRQVRAALGDTSRRPQYIETIRRFGYRFLVPIKEAASDSVSGSAHAWFLKGRSRRKMRLLLLPFRIADREEQHLLFAEGLAELLAVHLLQASSLWLFECAVDQGGRDKQRQAEVARDMNADAFVDGSIVWDNDRVRIMAQAVHARTERIIWAESFERDFRQALALQREVAVAIATALKIQLTPHDRVAWSKNRPVAVEASEEYLKGRFFLGKRTTEALQKSIEHFRRAIQTDPEYALGYAGLADSYIMLGHYAGPPHDTYPQAKAAAMKALKIDETLAEARTSLGFVSFIYDWDWLSAEREFRRAIELDPRYANAHHWCALYLTARECLSEALEEIRRARELDPLSLIIEETVGWILYFAGRFDEAIEHYSKALEMDPTFMPAHDGLGLALEQKGMFRRAIREFNEAITLSNGATQSLAARGHAYAVSGKRKLAKKVLDELRSASKQKYVSSYGMALVHTGLGEKVRAFAWLDRAVAERSTDLIWLKVDPRLAPLRGDPRFGALVRRVGLP